MSKRSNQQGVATAIIIIAVILVGAGATGAYFLTEGFGMNDNSSSGDVKSIKDKAQDTSGVEDGQVPDGFPADMPIYPAASIVTGAKDEEDGGYRLGLSTKDGEAKVIDYYKSELAKNGWAAKESIVMDNILSVSNEQWSGSVTIVESKTTDSGTTISYIINKK